MALCWELLWGGPDDNLSCPSDRQVVSTRSPVQAGGLAGLLWRITVCMISINIVVLASHPLFEENSLDTITPGDAREEVGIGVILPNDNRRLFSIRKTAPAVDYAIQKISRMGWLSNHQLNVKYEDSKCDSTAAPIAAFNFYMKRQVQVFLGPVCDYSLAPVARYAPFWSIPVISPGGMAHDFGNKRGDHPEFPLLTRVGFNSDFLARHFIETMDYFNWTNVKVVYSPDGHSDVVNKFCYLAMSGFARRLRLTPNKKFYLYHMVKNNEDIDRMLLEEIGTKHAGKWEFTHCGIH